MRSKLAALIIMATTSAHAGEVQCSCPTVSAKGTGDTSCSATETGGKCTIDFNTFSFEDEQAAADLLASSTPWSITYQRFDRHKYPGGFNSEQAQLLANYDVSAFVDQLLVYILVSGVQMDFNLDSEALAALHNSLRQNGPAIAKTFNGGGSSGIEGEFPGRALITRGCVEITLDRGSYWGMFKAFWAENRMSPQCR